MVDLLPRSGSRPSDDNDPGYARAAAWAGAAVALGEAIQLGNGAYDDEGIWWLTAGILLAWAGLLFPASRRAGRWLAALTCAVFAAVCLARAHVNGFASPAVCRAVAAAFGVAAVGVGFNARRVSLRQFLWTACLAGLAFEAWELFSTPPLVDGVAPPAFFHVALPLLAVLGTLAWAGGTALRRACVPLLLAAHFVTGAWLLRHSPEPFIDVYAVTKRSCEAMSRGVDPYSIDFPDIYQGHPDWEKAFYPEGFLYGGRVHFGYQYTPLSFAVAYAGHVLGGDFRLGNLLAITLAGAFIAYARRGWVAPAAAAVFLLTPRGFMVAERGWSEPAVVVCLGAAVFCACRFPRVLPYAVGLLMVSKQHMALAAPAVLLLLPRPWSWKTAAPFLSKAAATGAAVTLPMVLWDARAFWHSAVEVQLKNPFRSDSLNYAAAWARAGHPRPPASIEFAAAAVAAAVAVWRAPRTPAGFAAAVAAIYLTFFAVAKQAFCNYYFLTIGAVCCAVAAWGGTAWERTPEPSDTTVQRG